MSKYNEAMDKIKVTDDMKKRILQNIEDTNFDNVTAFDPVPKKSKKENKIISFVRSYGAVAAMFAVVLVGAYAVFGTMSGNKSMESATLEAPSATYEMVEEATEAAYEEAEADEAAPVMEAKGTEDSAMMMEPSAVPDASAKSENTKDATGTKPATEDGTETAAMGIVVEFSSAAELSAEAGYEISDIDSLLAQSSENHYLLYENGMIEIDYYVDGGNVYYRKATEEAASEYANGNITGDYIDYADVVTRNIEGTEVTLQGTGDAFNVASWTMDGVRCLLVYEKGLEDSAMMSLLDEILVR